MLSINLKEKTKDAHQNLEKIVVSKLKAVKNNDDYIDLLKYFYAYFLQLEDLTNLYHIPGEQSRRKAQLLAIDLTDLGANLETLPAITLPQINERLQALGAIYVMEGSTLGGQHIIRMLEKTGVTSGFTFYRGYGDATMQKWSEFTSTIDELASTNEEESIVIAAANETFRHFSDAFNNLKIN